MKLLATLVFIVMLIDFTYSCKCQKIQCNGDGDGGDGGGDGEDGESSDGGDDNGNSENTPTPTKDGITTTSITPNTPKTPKTPTTTAITTTSTTKTIPSTTTTTTATSTIPTTTTTLATPNTTMTSNITGSCLVHVGNSKLNNKSAKVSEGCECPDVINKANWFGGGYYDDEFAVTQNGTSLVVERIDDNGGWWFPLAFMCEESVCQKAYGEDYTGSVNITKSGFTCQNWNSQFPHNHTLDYVGDHNYCRDPYYKDVKDSVWCFTTNPNTTWEVCDVPLCDCDVTEFTCLGDNYCLPEYYICDYYEDCRDGSDEGTVCDDFYGDWSSWSNWTTCSATCGIGAKTRTRTCLEKRCREAKSEQTSYCKLPSCGPFIEQKCFLNTSIIELLDLGQNHMSQNIKPIWNIMDDGRHLYSRENTRPSIGLSNLGNTSAPVSFSGRVFSNDYDNDVIGMVFGFWNETNFFVIASSQHRPGPTNWYVGRLHATCDQSCGSNTTISNAIWAPQSHPEDITVLASGTNNWRDRNSKYNFSVCFNPSELLLTVNITAENEVEPMLESLIISAKTNDTDVDEISRLGGFVGVYVDSQADTNWDHLNCQECDIIE